MNEGLRAHAEQRVGQIIKGKYRVDRVLGMGGMAVVYAVTHTRNNAELALKMLHPELGIREDIRQRFLREGYAANSVKHRGVVTVVDDDVAEDGAVFIVMEKLSGAGVETLWEKHRGKLPVSASVALVDQLLDVLAAAHAKGIVHRDIKPANLFLTLDGVVKVLDFGIARVRDALAQGAQQTGSGVLMGTPAFMSPEQALAKQSDIDGQCDVWAAAATLFTLVSGRFVHEAENAPQMLVKAATKPAPSLASVAPSVPPAIVDVVARGLAFDKKDRWVSATAMRDALRNAHRAAYGALPSRDALEALFADAATVPTELGEAPAKITSPRAFTEPLVPVVSPAASAPVRAAGGTTAEPVSADPPSPSARATPSSSRTPLFAAIAAVVVLGAGALYAKTKLTSPTSAPTDTASGGATSVASAAPTMATPTTPATTSVAATPPPPATTTAPTATTTATSHASVWAMTSTKPSASTARPPPSAPPSAVTSKPTVNVPGCDPPYVINENGMKHFKPECN